MEWAVQAQLGVWDFQNSRFGAGIWGCKVGSSGVSWSFMQVFVGLGFGSLGRNSKSPK